MNAGITFEIMSESDRKKCIDQAFRILGVQGALTMTNRAQAKMRELLATHTPEPLPGDIAAQLDEIVSKAEKAEHAVTI